MEICWGPPEAGLAFPIEGARTILGTHGNKVAGIVGVHLVLVLGIPQYSALGEYWDPHCIANTRPSITDKIVMPVNMSTSSSKQVTCCALCAWVN